MGLKKLTGEEILAILEENYDVHAFGYDDMTETNEEVEFSDEEIAETENAGKRRDAFYEAVKGNFEDLPHDEKMNHPDRITWTKLPTKWDAHRNAVTNKLGLGRVVEVEQRGGSDEGSNWYSVKHFVDHNIYIKTTGYYQSYNGTDFHDGMGEVVSPQQKTVTVFE